MVSGRSFKELPVVDNVPCDAVTEERNLVARAVYFWGIWAVTSQIASGLVCLAHSKLQSGKEEMAKGGGTVPSSPT